MFEFSFEAMGTVLQIKVLNQVSNILEEKIKSEIFDFTVMYDEEFSRFKPNSLVTKISESTGTYKVPHIFTQILKIYFEFFEISSGAMNPLIGNSISDLGYDSVYTLRPKESIRTTPKLDEVIQILNDTEILVKEKVLIDIGALGKGFWVDQVAIILERNGITNYIINGSGDILYKSSLKDDFISIALEGTDTKVNILNEALCGSGTGRRNWSLAQDENLHHIIDARNSLPTKNYETVFIRAKTCTLADALTTAIFFVSPETLEQKYDFEYYILDTNKKTLFSKNFFGSIT